MLKKITKTQARQLGKEHNINFDVVPFEEWHYGLNVELEHQNLTHGSLEKTVIIALAHLNEFPDYYKFLYKLEAGREKYWSKREKPSIFNN
jgi:hypothetical protein